MAGALRKTMLYLGFADDRGNQEYDDEYSDDYVEDFHVEHEAEADMAREHQAQVTPINRSMQPSNEGAPVLRRITTVHPRSYNDARAIGEAFRAGTPVIINLSDMSDADAKRLVDFAAGLIFGLHGAIERVTAKVFLLSPESVEIAGEGHNESGVQAGLYNQS